MKKTETEQILEYLKHIYESIHGPLPKARSSSEEPPLTRRVGALEKKVDTLDKRVGGLEKKVGGLEKLTGRIIDLEVPGPGGRGGSPSGSGGVPLAS